MSSSSASEIIRLQQELNEEKVKRALAEEEVRALRGVKLPPSNNSSRQPSAKASDNKDEEFENFKVFKQMGKLDSFGSQNALKELKKIS